MKIQDSRMRYGFTLVEIMVALTLGTLVMILIMYSFTSLSTSLAATGHYRDLHHDVRHAMDLLQKDITGASSVTQCITSNRLILSVGSSSVAVTYNLSNHILLRTVGSGPAATNATGVDGITFTLYDASGATTMNPADAYFVEVEMAMKAQGVRDTYMDKLQMRSRMRLKGL